MILRIYTHWLILFLLVCNHVKTNTINSIPLDYVRLHLPRAGKLYFYDQTPIRLRHKDAYTKLIDRWQEKLNKGAIKLFSAFEKETGMSAQELFFHAGTDNIARQFAENQKPKVAQIENVIDQDHMAPEILAFLKKNWARDNDQHHATFFITSDMNSLVRTVAQDTQNYHVFVHEMFYNKKSLQLCRHQKITKNRICFIEPCKNDTDLRWIDLSALLHLGITEAATSIRNQKHVISFMLQNGKFNGNHHVSKETIELHSKLETMHAILSAVFQSRNPLEAAVFYLKGLSPSASHYGLCKALVKEIAATYSTSCLQKMKEIAHDIRRSNSRRKN